MFVYAGQQPLRFRDPALLAVPRNSHTFLPDLVTNFRDAGQDLTGHMLSFDYILMHGHDPAPERRILPLDRLRLVQQVGEFRLYAVVAGPGNGS
jgi:hypothetical protein